MKPQQNTADEARRVAAYELGEKHGANEDQLDAFRHQIGRWPDQHECRQLANGQPPHQAILLGASALRDGQMPSIVHVKKKVWTPETRGAAPVYAYADLEVQAQTGLVSRLLNLRFHDGDDSKFAERDADGKIVQVDPGPGLFPSGITIRQSPTFRAKHVLGFGSMTDATWPSAADGARYKSFDDNADARGFDNPRIVFWVAIIRGNQGEGGLHNDWMGKHVDDLRGFLADAPPDVLMSEPTELEKLAAENVALKAQAAGFDEVLARLAALEAQR